MGINFHLPLHWLRSSVTFNPMLKDSALAHVQQVLYSVCGGKDVYHSRRYIASLAWTPLSGIEWSNCGSLSRQQLAGVIKV